MAHPSGGHGNRFNLKHSFAEAYAFVGTAGVKFRSTTGEHIHAQQGWATDGVTPTIVFRGERNVHGNACKACWGFRVNCNKARVGQCAEALDSAIKGTSFEIPPSVHPERVGPKIKEPPSVSADSLNAWRRQLLRWLSKIDRHPVDKEGVVSKIKRLSAVQTVLPKETAALMVTVVEMRNTTEYRFKELTRAESEAARYAWLAIVEWAKAQGLEADA